MNKCKKTISGKHVWESTNDDYTDHAIFHTSICIACSLVDDTFELSSCTENNCKFVSHIKTNARNKAMWAEDDAKRRKMGSIRRFFVELGDGD